MVKRKRTVREARGEFTQKNERVARDFLRERNLLVTFNRFKRIKSIKKIRITTEQDDISQRLVIHKRGDKLVIRDAFSLRVLSITKKFNFRTIRNAFQMRKEKSIVFKNRAGQDKQGILRENVLKLKEITRIPLTNVIQVDRSAPLRRKVGRLFINVTFIGKRGQRITVEGGSNRPRLLNVISQQRIAFNEAFRGALGNVVVDFSYESFIVNWIHFSYFEEKKRPQPIFQFEKALRAV